MKFHYCIICHHYHVSAPELPCYFAKDWDARSLFNWSWGMEIELSTIRRQSQEMLNSRKVFLSSIITARMKLNVMVHGEGTIKVKSDT